MGFRRAAGRLTGLLSGASQLKHPFTAPTLKPTSNRRPLPGYPPPIRKGTQHQDRSACSGKLQTRSREIGFIAGQIRASRGRPQRRVELPSSSDCNPGATQSATQRVRKWPPSSPRASQTAARPCSRAACAPSACSALPLLRGWMPKPCPVVVAMARPELPASSTWPWVRRKAK